METPPGVRCPIPDCAFVAEHTDLSIIAALLSIHGKIHDQPPSSQDSRTTRVKRPEITSRGTTTQWTYFLTRWEDFKEATKPKQPEIPIQLMECCDEELRADLIGMNGGTLARQTEQQVLEAIKALAVKRENKIVSIDTLGKMVQHHDEPILKYWARVKAQASVCQFQTTLNRCNCTQSSEA